MAQDIPAAPLRRIDELKGLCHEVIQLGYRILDLNIDFSGFECWELVVCKEKSLAFSFFWDGRDKYLSIQVSPQNLYSYPNQWKDVELPGLGSEDPFANVISYLSADD